MPSEIKENNLNTETVSFELIMISKKANFLTTN